MSSRGRKKVNGHPIKSFIDKAGEDSQFHTMITTIEEGNVGKVFSTFQSFKEFKVAELLRLRDACLSTGTHFVLIGESEGKEVSVTLEHPEQWNWIEYGVIPDSLDYHPDGVDPMEGKVMRKLLRKEPDKQKYDMKGKV